MKNFYQQFRLIWLTLIFLAIGFWPLLSLAAGTGPGKLIPCDGVTVKCDFAMIIALINNVINFFFVNILTPAATIAIVWAGFMTINEARQGKDASIYKKILSNVVLGFFFSFAAWVVIRTILDLATGGAAGTTIGREVLQYFKNN